MIEYCYHLMSIWCPIQVRLSAQFQVDRLNITKTSNLVSNLILKTKYWLGLDTDLSPTEAVSQVKTAHFRLTLFRRLYWHPWCCFFVDRENFSLQNCHFHQHQIHTDRIRSSAGMNWHSSTDLKESTQMRIWPNIFQFYCFWSISLQHVQWFLLSAMMAF